MTDVLKIALERRSKLQDEVAKLDDFIRMAETLISGPVGAPAPAPVAEVEVEEAPARPAVRRQPEPEAAAEKTDVPRPSIIRRGLAAG